MRTLLMFEDRYKAMSTPELLESIQKLRQAASGVHHNPSLFDSVIMYLNAAEAEYKERMQLEKTQKEIEKNPPGVIEIGSIKEER